MRTKTSVTLSDDVLAGVQRAAQKGESRSRAIDRLLRERLITAHARGTRAREVERLNRHAAALNREARDVLSYQEDQ